MALTLTSLRAQQSQYFNLYFQSKSDKITEQLRKYKKENAIMITEDYDNGKLQFSAQITGTSDIDRLNDFLHFIRQLGTNKKFKDSFKDLEGEFKFYYQSGKPSEEIIFKKNKIYYTQAWTEDGIAQLTLGTGIKKHLSNEDNSEVYEEYRDSLLVKYYQVRTSSKDTIYANVDKQAEPKEGVETFYHELTKILKYPLVARFLGKEGRVFVSFVVDDNGKLTEFIAKSKEGYRLEDKLIQKLRKLPNWNPAIFHGRKVKTRMVLPVKYALTN